MKNNIPYPLYVKMINGIDENQGTTLRLCKDINEYYYYRDAGNWRCGINSFENILMSKKNSILSISEKILKEITFTEWKKENFEYVNKDFTKEYHLKLLNKK